MRGSINRRFGAVGVRRGRFVQKAGGAGYWDLLESAVSTITPVSLWYADASFLTLDGSDNVSGWADAWSSNDAAQATAARRPNFDGTDVVFDVANTEWLDITGISESSGDWTVLVMCNNVSAADVSRVYLSCATGSIRIYQSTTLGAGYVGFYDGSNRASNAVSVTGVQYLIYKLKTGGLATMRRSGVLLGGGPENYTQRAWGGSYAAIGAKPDGATMHIDAKVRGIALYSGTDDTDITALETLAAEIMGL